MLEKVYFENSKGDKIARNLVYCKDVEQLVDLISILGHDPEIKKDKHNNLICIDKRKGYLKTNLELMFRK